MEQLGHLQHSERLDVLKHFLVFFLFKEPLGFDHECLLVVRDLLEDSIIANDGLLEVVGIEVDSIDSVGHLLRLISFNVLLLLNILELKFAITVCGQTRNFLSLPRLLIGLNGLQGKPLLVI